MSTGTFSLEPYPALYVLDAYEGGLPSARHVSILVDAAIKAGAPDDYVQWLRARPCNPPSTPSGSHPAAPDIPGIPDEPAALLRGRGLIGAGPAGRPHVDPDGDVG